MERDTYTQFLREGKGCGNGASCGDERRWGGRDGEEGMGSRCFPGIQQNSDEGTKKVRREDRLGEERFCSWP